MNWASSLLSLAPKSKPSQSLLKINDSGIESIEDLLWITPLRVQKKPEIGPFSNLHVDSLFLGRAKLMNVKIVPAFGRRGKGKIQLFNVSAVVKDCLSDQYLTLKWFNSYPNIKKQLEQYDEFTFMGTPTDFKGIVQIINPKINPTSLGPKDEMLIEYPTINSVSGKHVKSIIDRIPHEMWNEQTSILPSNLENELGLISCSDAFKIIHGKKIATPEDTQKAKDRIIYEEFLKNHLKVTARKLKNKKLKAPQINIAQKDLETFIKIFPYDLTEDQIKVLSHLTNDLKSGSPMMRMVQGDVGCGKTTIAIIAGLTLIKNGYQVAFMCPTEALATQHADTLSKICPENINIGLLLGSTKQKAKKHIYEQLENGEMNLVIGTHSLIQESVKFLKLGLAIIDEQHKFGVEQRQKLIQKGDGVHTLIMTATPIPRSLQLAQYGDLDISTIKHLPGGRKGIKTRIVTTNTYEKYLSFLKTRMTMGEQVYIVAPAIEESEILNIKNVENLLIDYKKFFPDFEIAVLHGQLKPDEKKEVMERFSKGEINLLISTTVIEVGINVINSTVISIYNPDRFGLSSLHQLRGRVGRGSKAGFCFLITDKNISHEALTRIKVIENTIDGFEIAEADLKNRGQGDLFGSNQSGHITNFKLANLIEHISIFEQVTQDIEQLKIKYPEFINNTILSFINDFKVSSTI